MTVQEAIEILNYEKPPVEYQGRAKEAFEMAIKALEEQSMCNEFLEDIKIYNEYRALEEQGLLVKLPCKVGDAIYQPLMDGQINEYKVIGLCYDITCKEWLLEVAIQIGNEWFKTICEIKCIGKTVFLTKEEAEAKLKEVEGE